MSNNAQFPGRFYTEEQKRLAIERLFNAWMRVPDLRLGQLLDNATGGKDAAIFYAEDEDLMDAIEAYAYPRSRSK